MPTTYAHYRFGCDVLAQLPTNLQKQITPFQDLYNIGLHGPDILFYYKALTKNPISKTGFIMHDKPAKEFFQAAKLAMEQVSEPEPSLAYLYGFICHFALDCTCHPYVEESVRATDISHSEIEAELDRTLMTADGHNPITYHPVRHLKATESSVLTISRFFPSVNKQQIYKSIKSTRWYCDQLVAPSPLKRKIIFTSLKLAGSYDSIHNLIINYTPNAACTTICTTLEDLYLKAIPLAIDLISGYQPYLQDDQKLDSRFNRTFGEH